MSKPTIASALSKALAIQTMLPRLWRAHPDHSVELQRCFDLNATIVYKLEDIANNEETES